MEQTAPLRRCGRCNLLKPLDDFNPKKKEGKWQGYCKPCHAEWKREYYEQHRAIYIEGALKYKAKLKAFIRAAKDNPCADCGVRYPHYVMDFDHREGEIKLANISALNQHRRVSIPKLAAEIAKCDLVCANCHRERTYQRLMKKQTAEVS
jgi:hypothetical protein